MLHGLAYPALSAIAVLFGLLLWLGLASAQSSSWVDRLQNDNGNVCCFDNDGRRLDDPEWRPVDPTFEVLFTEGWIKVPTWAVVKQRNRDGIARVWSYVDVDDGGNGTRQIRCFLPGALS